MAKAFEVRCSKRSNRANQQIVICCRSASKFRETCICLRLSYPFLTTEADMISVDCWEQGLQNRWEPVRFDRLPVWPGSGLGRYQTGPNSKFKFEFKKMKNSQKLTKNISRCDEFNSVKFSQKIVHLI